MPLYEVPENIGTPTKPKPQRCMNCCVPVWRWNGQEWVCWNDKLYAVIHEHSDADLSTLDGCQAGLYKSNKDVQRTLPDHECYHCWNTQWVYDRQMHAYRCSYCFPEGRCDALATWKARVAQSRAEKMKGVAA